MHKRQSKTHCPICKAELGYLTWSTDSEDPLEQRKVYDLNRQKRHTVVYAHLINVHKWRRQGTVFKINKDRDET